MVGRPSAPCGERLLGAGPIDPAEPFGNIDEYVTDEQSVHMRTGTQTARMDVGQRAGEQDAAFDSHRRQRQPALFEFLDGRQEHPVLQARVRRSQNGSKSATFSGSEARSSIRNAFSYLWPFLPFFARLSVRAFNSSRDTRASAG